MTRIVVNLRRNKTGKNENWAHVIALLLINKSNESTTHLALFAFVLQRCALTRFTHRAEWVGLCLLPDSDVDSAHTAAAAAEAAAPPTVQAALC